jgi:hypothetical protein
LDLSLNAFQGALPTRIGELTSLRRLYLNGNAFTGQIPLELSSLSNIWTIRIDENDFGGIVPRELCNLYNEIKPYSFADCNELAFADCFLWCCDNGDCTCRLEDTVDFGDCFTVP